MATLPTKNALVDLSGGYYAYWTDGTTEGRATVAVLLGSTDAAASAAAFASLDSTPIGATTPSTGSFTDLAATGTVSLGGVLDDLITLGAAAADGEFIVATGAGAFAYESGATARASLGLVIGTDVQAYDADLAEIAALDPTANQMIYAGAGGTWATTSLTVFARTILDDANAASVRSTIGVDPAGTDNSTDVTLAGAYNYLTLAGQEITLAQIDLTTDVTGALPIANAAFTDQNVLTTSSPTFAGLTVDSTLTLASGSITDSSGAISFGNENLSTNGVWTIGSVAVNSGEALSAAVAGHNLSGTYDVLAKFASTDAGGYGIRLGQDGSDGVISGIGTSGLQFWTYNGLSWGTRYSISSTGNHDFQSGSITTTGTLASGAATVSGTGQALTVYNTVGSLSATKDITANFQRSDGTYGPRLQIRHSTDGTDLNHLYSTSADRLTLSIAGSEKLGISNSGATVTGTLGVTRSTVSLFRSSITNTSATPAQTDLLIGNPTSGDQLYIGTNYTSSGGAFIDTRTNDGEFSLRFVGTKRHTFTTSGASITGTLAVSASTIDAFTISASANVTRVIAMERSAAVRARIGIDSLNGWYVETNSSTALTLDSSQNATFAGNVTQSVASTTATHEIYASTHNAGAASVVSLDMAFQHSGGKATGGIRIQERSTNSFDGVMYLSAPYNNGGGGSSEVDILTLDGFDSSATFAGDLTLSAGDLTVSEGALSVNSGIANTTATFESTDDNAVIILKDNDTTTYLAAQNQVLSLGFNAGANAGNANILSDGSFILGSTSTSSNAQFYATKTFSNASGTDHGHSATYLQSVATTGQLVGNFTYTRVNHSTGTVATAKGIYGYTSVTNTGNTTSIYGVQGTARNDSTGTITNAYGMYSFVGAQNASGTITNAYGLYVDTITRTGTVTNGWGIYQAGASENNYFAGDLRIGTTSAGPNSENLVVDSGSSGIAGYFDSGITQRTLVLHTDDTTNGKQLVLHDAGSSGYATSMIGSKSDALLFYTGSGGTERFRVAADAYAIGIGTTDVESWSSSYAAIEFGRSAVWAANTDDSLYLTTNAYFDGSNKYKTADSGGSAQLIIAQGAYQFRSAASGAADSVISYTTNMLLTNDGMLLVGDTANTGMTVGLTINQGANDDEILAFKSSDVAHGMTSISETDTYGSIRKASGSSGGLLLDTFGESSLAMVVRGNVVSNVTTKTTSSRGGIDLRTYKKSGTSIGANDANANLISIGDAANVRFIVDKEGDFHYDGADGGAFDVYEDAHLVRAFANATSKETVRTAHDDWVQYNEQTLVDIGVLGAPVSEGGLINGAQLQRVHTGAIWQNYMAISDTKDEVETLRARLDIAETKLAIAESKLKQLPQA